MYYTDLDLIRARLVETDLPAEVQLSYLQVLANLNALSILLTPEGEDDLDAPEHTQLSHLFAQHQQRRVFLETEYPALAVLSRPKGWGGN
ncbi:hypothetical protein E7T06_06160 [Deinococcus sp. Arct2-2]|uniref:hypothetical protein n=1 Tax=Deinococcus sp. Arct2-2 TaxID=2568653 RepID=UPI0010A322A1|nr:hypothetical protein [Deinococcus sp. Arct2-2]THF70719.1 hypothetical protein E7T06_06160 [Deinococcus sp. Arct2-2]